MKKEEVMYLGQLLKDIEKNADELEQAFDGKEIKKFNFIKKQIIEKQEKVLASIK